MALGLALFAGTPTLAYDALLAGSAEHQFYSVLVTPDQAGAARWLRANSGPTDLLATNEHYVGTDGASASLVYWLPAYSERRELVGSWQYAPRLMDHPLATGQSTPAFWDQRLLFDNDIVFVHPTRARLAKLRDTYGVRWLVVNRRAGREPPELATLARLRHERGAIAVYQLAP